MSEDQDQEAKLRQYLLGQMTLEEQVLIEQRLFLDSDYAQLAQSVEDDLIDEYVQDDLTQAEREKFENQFLNREEYRDDIRIAQALDHYLTAEAKPVTGQGGNNFSDIPIIGLQSTEIRGRVREAGVPRNNADDHLPITLVPTPERRRPVLWLALAAAVLIILSVITWIVFHSTRKPAGERLQAGGPSPAPTQSASPQQQPSPSQETAGPGGTPPPNKTPSNDRDRQQPQPTPSFATVMIPPGGGMRGSAQPNSVTITEDVENVLLQIPVITVRDYEKYHFELLANGRVLVVRNLNVSVDKKLGRIVSVLLPHKLFKEQSYEIRLRGITTDRRPGESTTYAFTISKQQ